MSEKLSVYVVTHKKVNLSPLELDACYQLIRVGEYGKEKSALLSDRAGDSIAEKNANYCELTALYWIWKNDHTSEYVGLCHYRRYLTTAALSNSPKYILNQKKAEELLRSYDVLVARKEYSYRGAYRAYLDCGRERDLRTLEEAVNEICPEYREAFVSEFKNSAGNYPANMLVCKKEILDAYCAWLFQILGYVEQHTDLSGYSVQEARIYGYLSERLLGVWLKKQGLRVKELRILNTEQKQGCIRECCKAMGLEQAAKKLVYKIRK